MKGKLRNYSTVWLRWFLLLIAVTVCVQFKLNAQDHAVQGTVTALADGSVLTGVNVVIKGTTSGTVTDIDGNYSISVPDRDAVLVFSFIGFTTKEVPVGNRSIIDVAIESDIQQLGEVVVVGYGTKKKVNLTGSVAEISGKSLSKTNALSAIMALEGQLSGVRVRQQSGNPSSSTGLSTVTIRGRGTFSGAGNSPLVLVDGIESSLDGVDPNNIKSMTVLKDAASAAIYGSKAANGVILIQTKEGAPGEMKVTYQSHFSKVTPTFIPEMVDSWEYANAVNEANLSGGLSPMYTEEDIQKFKSGEHPMEYPNFDHLSYLFNSGRGVENKHYIGISGGGENTRYLFSGSYYDQQAIIKRNEADRYDIRLNLDTKLNHNLNFSFKMNGNRFHGKEPVSSVGVTNLNGIVLSALRNSNAIHGVRPDGYYGMLGVTHPEADLNSESLFTNIRSNFYGNAALTWDITNNLSITGRGGYLFNTAQTKRFRASYPVTENFKVSPSTLNEDRITSQRLILQSILRYNKTFNYHNINLLAGFESHSNKSDRLGAFRDQFPNNLVTQLNVGSVTNDANTGVASMYTLESYFGRAGYNFRDKYLFEFNFRYDGSSRFPSDRRWAFFPSASAGWRISNESFLQDVSWLNNLKIRASWGQLGNQSIGNYPYQSQITLNINYPFGNDLVAGGAVTTIPTKDITWETTTITDVGLDVALLDNKIEFTADYYVKETSDILYDITVAQMLGATPSPTNAGVVENKGWDFSASYNNNLGDFYYDVSANFSIVHNKVKKLANVERDIARGLFVGHPIGSGYGWVSDGLYADDEDVENSPTSPFAFMNKPGAIKLVDISGPDGTPDGVISAEYDRTVLGNPAPNTIYGLTLTGGYKNFDFHFLFQGAAGREHMNPGVYFYPLGNNGNVQRFIYENRWIPDQPNPDAQYPRIQRRSYAFYTQNPMSFWFRSATYVRLKTVQLGYSLPKRLMNNSPFEKVRFYISGRNLFTISEYYPGWDPEMQAAGSFYPLLKKYTIGIQVDL